MEKRRVRMVIEDKIKLGLYIKKLLPGIEKLILIDNIWYITINKKFLHSCIVILKSNLHLKLVALMDIWCVDYPQKVNRFEINYLLVSLKYNFKIILKVNVSETDSIASVSNIFGSAGWLEREIWDMQGVFFTNNLDLRRILTDYGFEGYPLRKDFPMSGFVEIRYDDTEKRIVQELLEVSQEYRIFNFKSPWEKL